MRKYLVDERFINMIRDYFISTKEVQVMLNLQVLKPVDISFIKNNKEVEIKGKEEENKEEVLEKEIKGEIKEETVYFNAFKCSNCGRRVNEHWNYCPWCGEEKEDK